MSAERLRGCLQNARDRVGIAAGLALRPSRNNLVDCERALNDAVLALHSAVGVQRIDGGAGGVVQAEAQSLQRELVQLRALLENASGFHQTISDIVALGLSGYDKTGRPAKSLPGCRLSTES
jgi:hypothetical protein